MVTARSIVRFVAENRTYLTWLRSSVASENQKNYPGDKIKAGHVMQNNVRIIKDKDLEAIKKLKKMLGND